MFIPINLPTAYKNSIVVQPGDDLQAKYDDLVADGSMGTLSASNPRYLRRPAGAYSGNLSVSTKYVYLLDEDGVTDTGAITYTTAWYGSGSGDGSTKALAIDLDSYQAWNALANTTADQAKIVQIVNDIDFEGKELQPLTAWSGTFYGNNFTIKDYKITKFSGKNATGLFIGNEGTVQDIKTKNAYINASGWDVGEERSYAGIIAAENSNGAIFKNCHAEGTLIHEHQGTSYCGVGMIVSSNHGNVIDCTAKGTIAVTASAGSELRCGSLVGYQTDASGGSVGVCQDSTADVNILILNDTLNITVVQIGGCVGVLVSNYTNVNKVHNCHWVGEIRAEWTAPASSFGYIGGILGTALGDCYGCSSVGSIRANSSPTNWLNVGGGIGRIVSTALAVAYDSCFANTDLSIGGTTDWVGGFVGASYETITNCYAKGSIYDLDADSTALELDYYGGFVGRFVLGTIDNCWCAIDTYTVGSGSYIKGFAGYIHTTTSLTGCFWDSDTSSIVAANADATAKTTSELMTVATYSSYDLTLPARDWKMQADLYSYPKLDWEE